MSEIKSFPFLERFAKFRFISCGEEINKRISHFTKKIFNLKTPISNEDLELVNIVKNQNILSTPTDSKKINRPSNF